MLVKKISFFCTIMSQEINYPTCQIKYHVRNYKDARFSWCDNVLEFNSEKFCKKHQCIIGGCNNYRYSNEFIYTCYTPPSWDKLSYCKTHKCKDCDCNKKLKNSDYCNKHTCKYDGCFEYALWDYCEKHMCYKNNCYNVILQEYKQCNDHTCRHVGCKNEYKNEYTKMCECHSYLCDFCKTPIINKLSTRTPTLHQDCACDVGTCINPKGSNSMFCNEHKFLEKH